MSPHVLLFRADRDNCRLLWRIRLEHGCAIGCQFPERREAIQAIPRLCRNLHLKSFIYRETVNWYLVNGCPEIRDGTNIVARTDGFQRARHVKRRIVLVVSDAILQVFAYHCVVVSVPRGHDRENVIRRGYKKASCDGVPEMAARDSLILRRVLFEMVVPVQIRIVDGELLQRIWTLLGEGPQRKSNFALRFLLRLARSMDGRPRVHAMNGNLQHGGGDY